MQRSRKALAFDREARTGTVETLLAGLAAHTAPRARPVALLGAAILVAIAAVGLTYVALDRGWVSRHSVVVEERPRTLSEPPRCRCPTHRHRAAPTLRRTRLRCSHS